jgi:hypothetical protein
MVFCFVQNFFFVRDELEYLFFLSRKARIFFQETKRNKSKRNSPKRTEIYRNETKRNGIIQNEIKPILTKQFLGDIQNKN